MTIDTQKLAKIIARDIFEAGSDIGNKVQRIEFKSGWPNEERALGGYAEGPLADRILMTLAREIPVKDRH